MLSMQDKEGQEEVQIRMRKMEPALTLFLNLQDLIQLIWSPS